MYLGSALGYRYWDNAQNKEVPFTFGNLGSMTCDNLRICIGFWACFEIFSFSFDIRGMSSEFSSHTEDSLKGME